MIDIANRVVAVIALGALLLVGLRHIVEDALLVGGFFRWATAVTFAIVAINGCRARWYWQPSAEPQEPNLAPPPRSNPLLPTAAERRAGADR